MHGKCPTVGQVGTRNSLELRIDVNETVLLIDILIRKITGEKCLSLKGNTLSELEARSTVINVVEEFGKTLETTSNAPVEELIDLTEVQLNLFKAIISSNSNEIPAMLRSYVGKDGLQKRQPYKDL